MYYNQSFDEMPEDILLHGKLKNDGDIIYSSEIHRRHAEKRDVEST